MTMSNNWCNCTLESVWLIITPSPEITLEQKQYSQFLKTGVVDSMYVNGLKNYVLCFAILFLFDKQQSIFTSHVISEFLIFHLCNFQDPWFFFSLKNRINKARFPISSCVVPNIVIPYPHIYSSIIITSCFSSLLV